MVVVIDSVVVTVEMAFNRGCVYVIVVIMVVGWCCEWLW